MDKIFTMVAHEDEDLRYAADNMFALLASDASVREKLLTAGNIKGILKMLENDDWRARSRGLNVIADLVENGSECTAIFIPETVDKIFAMLGDEDQFAQSTAVKAVVTLASDASIREKLLSTGNIKAILKMLEDSSWVIRMSALNVITALVENANARRVSSRRPSIKSSRCAMVGDEDEDVRSAAVKAVVALAPSESGTQDMWHAERCVDIPHGIPTTETRQKTIHLLRHEQEVTKEIALSALDTLASLGHDILSIAIALTNTTLDGISQMAPAMRKSYCRVISLLPLAAHETASAVTIPLENLQKLLLLLRNPDADITSSAMEILTYCAANIQTVHAHAIKILHHPPTSRQALKMLTDLAQYDDVRRKILQSSGIVHTLLTMLKSGATNIHRWEVGFKGLLALGLF
ncbi:armadillo-type protein [Mycena latifolia]|nr:armadillo-type protein [Mycena latifolia]